MLSQEPVVPMHKHKVRVLVLLHWVKVDLPAMGAQEEYPTIQVAAVLVFLQTEHSDRIQQAIMHLLE